MAGNLNERAILEELNRLVENIRSGEMEDASATLSILGFERLLRPIQNSAVISQPQFVDLSGPFGVARVHQTSDHIRACDAALRDGDREVALRTATEALKRWQEG